jgi:alanyl-tRNA synthetase
LPNDVNATFTAQVDAHRRALTQRNHTGTHLLHHALRKVLGTHVEQKGSLVAPDRLRFDISHFAKITPEELARIEQEANAMVRADLGLEERRETPIKEALDMGAMALFGEKYGDKVRVIKFGESVELCGGTHVPRTGEIGLLRIVSEGALAAGIRRIEAITSEAAQQYVEERLARLEEVNVLLKHPADPVLAIKHLIAQNAELLKEVEKAGHERVARLQESLLAHAVQKPEGRLVVAEVDLDANGMRELAFRLKDQHKDLLLVLGAKHDGKALLAVMVGADLLAKGMKATDLIKTLAAEVKGGGGGQSFFATAGGKDPDGLPRALAKAKELLG